MTTQVQRGQRTSGLGLAIAVAVADLVFLAGVVVPHLADQNPLASPWIGLPALVLVFTLPLIAYGAVLASGQRLMRDRASGRRGRRVDLAVVVLAVAGFAAYVSPWGLASITGFMIALD